MGGFFAVGNVDEDATGDFIFCHQSVARRTSFTRVDIRVRQAIFGRSRFALVFFKKITILTTGASFRRRIKQAVLDVVGGIHMVAGVVEQEHILFALETLGLGKVLPAPVDSFGILETGISLEVQMESRLALVAAV